MLSQHTFPRLRCSPAFCLPLTDTRLDAGLRVPGRVSPPTCSSQKDSGAVSQIAFLPHLSSQTERSVTDGGCFQFLSEGSEGKEAGAPSGAQGAFFRNPTKCPVLQAHFPSRELWLSTQSASAKVPLLLSAFPNFSQGSIPDRGSPSLQTGGD